MILNFNHVLLALWIVSLVVSAQTFSCKNNPQGLSYSVALKTLVISKNSSDLPISKYYLLGVGTRYEVFNDILKKQGI
jgi:hypothetical protein